MDGLITSPEQLQEERDLDSPCTKRELMLYIKNHDKNVVMPAFQVLSAQIQQAFKQQQQYAMVVNNLIDFLETEGFRPHKDGRVRLNTQEWQVWMKKRALGNQRTEAAKAD
jgi:hypothetical protein